MGVVINAMANYKVGKDKGGGGYQTGEDSNLHNNSIFFGPSHVLGERKNILFGEKK